MIETETENTGEDIFAATEDDNSDADDSVETESEISAEEDSSNTADSDITDDELLDLIIQQLETLQSEVSELKDRS